MRVMVESNDPDKLTHDNLDKTIEGKGG